MNCLHCGAEVTNGLAVCDLCQRWARSVFAILPTYFKNLARWKPGRAGSRSVPGSRPPTSIGTVVVSRVDEALDEANNALTTWARAFANDRPHWARPLEPFAALILGEGDFDLTEAETVQLLCAGFDRHLVSFATLDWVGDFLADVGQHEERLRTLTESVAPGWYAGACGLCGTATYVVPGFTWVTCRGCGRTTYARDHINTVLSEARGWVARPMRLAEAIVALVDTEQSAPRLHKRISKWGERGQIETLRLVDRDGDEVGPKLFRLGDVLDRLEDEGSTRLDAATSERIGA